ncbi:MAG TPA: hypothetical protein EYP43_04635, partial [Thermoplasmata archaeon]|nr:hypothetical protein [Thermoplasmata archaeon]
MCSMHVDLILSVTLLLVIVAGTAGAATIIVDDDWVGADYQDIQSAIDAASDGDTILVYDGAYSESLIVNKSVTIQGNGSATVKVDAGGTGDGINITADNVTISGLNATNGGQHGIVAWHVGNTTITACSAVGNGLSGIEINASDNVTLSGNNISRNVDGILLHESSNVRISESWIFNNTRPAMDRWNDGIRLTGDLSNIWIGGNWIFRNDYGIDAYAYNLSLTGLTAFSNQIWGQRFEGVHMEYTRDSRLNANTIMGN